MWTPDAELKADTNLCERNVAGGMKREVDRGLGLFGFVSVSILLTLHCDLRKEQNLLIPSQIKVESTECEKDSGIV